MIYLRARGIKVMQVLFCVNEIIYNMKVNTATNPTMQKLNYQPLSQVWEFEFAQRSGFLYGSV